MWSNCEKALTRMMKDDHRSPLVFLLKGSMRFLSWGYAAGSSFHGWTFDNGWRRRYFPPVPVVVSIGNIVAGGTGKTPLTLKLAKEFSKDFKVAILTRGYRSPAENLSSPIALSVGKGPVYPSSYCGDEPYLLSENIPEALVYVGKNRKKSSIQAVKAGAKIIILDDGMQYRNLARDVEIVALNANDPFGEGFFLPRGMLRENPKSLARANLIVLNNGLNSEEVSKAKEHIAKYTNAPVVVTAPEIRAISDLEGNKIYSLRDKKVGLFCGIANPEYFRNLIGTYGAEVVTELTLPDHMAPKPHILKSYAEECMKKGAEYIICTEKDKVKISDIPELPLPILWVKIETKIVEGEEHWNTMIHQMRHNIEKLTRIQGVS